MNIKARFYLWLLHWAYIVDGLVGVLTFGFVSLYPLVRWAMQKYLDYDYKKTLEREKN